MKKYKKRIADEIIKKKLKGKGAVLVEGPKWCGKTTTSEELANSVLYMSQPDNVKQNMANRTVLEIHNNITICYTSCICGMSPIRPGASAVIPTTAPEEVVSSPFHRGG